MMTDLRSERPFLRMITFLSFSLYRPSAINTAGEYPIISEEEIFNAIVMSRKLTQIPLPIIIICSKVKTIKWGIFILRPRRHTVSQSGSVWVFCRFLTANRIWYLQVKTVLCQDGWGISSRAIKVSPRPPAAIPCHTIGTQLWSLWEKVCVLNKTGNWPNYRLAKRLRNNPQLNIPLLMMIMMFISKAGLIYPSRSVMIWGSHSFNSAIILAINTFYAPAARH